jgi:hypothetical protein
MLLYPFGWIWRVLRLVVISAMFFWREWWPERKMELGISRNKAIFSLLVLMLQC